MEVYAQSTQDQHFKIQILNLWMDWEKLCPNLSFTVENNMGNPHKKGWSHFKLNINDCDIPFPKSLRTFNELGKTFSIGENRMNPLWESCPYHKMFGQKAMKKYISSIGI